MIHKSILDRFIHMFPHDRQGHVPVHSDHWQEMDFEHTEMDPYEEGISEEERARRVEYLNTVWWPDVLEQVEAERRRLEEEHGHTFSEHWKSVVHRSPERPGGFGVT